MLKVHRDATGLLDTRAHFGSDMGVVVKKQRGLSMSTYFKTDQASAIAYYMSKLLAKGYDMNTVRETVNRKFFVNMTLKQVKIMYGVIRKLWRAEMAADMNDQIMQEVQTINVQMREAWEAWERSKVGQTSKTTRTEDSTSSTSDEMNYNLTETILKEDSCVGEVKFLSLINDLGKEKRKLLGLYAPDKKEDKGSGNTNIQINVVGSDGKTTGGFLGGLLDNQPATEEQEAEEVDLRAAEEDVAQANAELEEAPQAEAEPDLDSFLDEILNN